MRVGIEINGVLRNTLDKIEQTYQKFYIDKNFDFQDYSLLLFFLHDEELLEIHLNNRGEVLKK
jgi:hypothetical protein